ncbi:hypothetical protein D3C79_698760 [compost metagenome]
MADQLVQRPHILFGITGDAVGPQPREPAQGQALQMLGQAHPQAVAQVGIHAVGEVQCQGLTTQPQGRAEHRQQHPAHHPRRQRRRLVQAVGQMRQGHQRHQRTDPGDGLHRHR